MRITFKPWRELTVDYDRLAVQEWLIASGDAIQAKFTAGLTGGHSGRKYSNLPNQSSAPGEYPATQSGRLLGGTSKATVYGKEIEVGTTARHARYLMGTRKMAKRKMFDSALQEAQKPDGPRFAKFRRV